MEYLIGSRHNLGSLEQLFSLFHSEIRNANASYISLEHDPLTGIKYLLNQSLHLFVSIGNHSSIVSIPILYCIIDIYVAMTLNGIP